MNKTYCLFAASVFLPCYTYALYPVVLRALPSKSFRIKDIELSVSVIVPKNSRTNWKVENIKRCCYTKTQIILSNNIDNALKKASGDVVIITDTETKFDKNAIKEIVKVFADPRVGYAIGEQTNSEGNSVFWKYEKLVKILESQIGCVSGANYSIFAVRKKDMPDIPSKVLNKPFFIATTITQNGKSSVYVQKAKAYEKGTTQGVNFNKHVDDAVGYWQALMIFPKMLFPRKGSFVYVSHRVLKWFVWLNMITMYATSLTLSKRSKKMGALFGLQTVGYIAVLVYPRKGLFGKLIKLGEYFVKLNLSYLVGVFRSIK